MGYLDPDSSELSMISQMHLEAARQQGVEVSIEFIKSTELNNQHDPTHTFELPESLDILLDERPKKEVLRSLDWYNEDEEFKPLLAYISKEDIESENIDILLGTEIELPYQINSSQGAKRYEISDAKAIPPGPLYWVCKLVPVKGDYDNNVDENINQDEDNYEFLKVDEDEDILHVD